MKTPICSICLGSDILCKACKTKLDNGLISNSDVNISRIVYDLSKEIKSLDKVTIEKIIETDNFVVIICGKGDTPNMIGKGGIVVKKLSKIIKKNVKIVEKADNMKDFAQKLFYPLHVLGINIVYKPEGDAYKIVLAHRKVPIEKSLVDVLKIVFGKEVIIDYHEKDSGG